MADKSSKGIEHVLSVPTFGPKQRTILATHQGMVTLGTPLPNDSGWAYAIILPDGSVATAEATKRYQAVYDCCQQLGVDPVKVLGRALTERAETP